MTDPDIRIDDARWRNSDLRHKLRKAAKLALKLGGADNDAELTILLTDDPRLSELNEKFRGKKGPTNVLSFPADRNAGNYLGDVAISFETCRKESLASRKSFSDHATHLAVHGVLHLLGFDHVRAADARRMETLETKILLDLGIADPYTAQIA